jgi:hypothetical protein
MLAEHGGGFPLDDSLDETGLVRSVTSFVNELADSKRFSAILFLFDNAVDAGFVQYLSLFSSTSVKILVNGSSPGLVETARSLLSEREMRVVEVPRTLSRQETERYVSEQCSWLVGKKADRLALVAFELELEPFELTKLVRQLVCHKVWFIF